MEEKKIVKELMAEIRRQMNGAVSQSMREYGQKDRINFGVSLPTIKDIAMQYAPNHELACELSLRTARESHIAALYIADPTLLTLSQMEQWSEGWENEEIARLSAMLLFYKSPEASKVAEAWIEQCGTLHQISALYIIGKLARSVDAEIARKTIDVGQKLASKETLACIEAEWSSFRIPAVVYALRELYYNRVELRDEIQAVAVNLPDLKWQIEE